MSLSLNLFVTLLDRICGLCELLNEVSHKGLFFRLDKVLILVYPVQTDKYYFRTNTRLPLQCFVSHNGKYSMDESILWISQIFFETLVSMSTFLKKN